MQNTQTAEQKIAESLLKIKAVKLSPKAPFTWASGWKSPIYCDNRQTLSFPEARLLIRDEFVRNIRDKVEGYLEKGQKVMVIEDLVSTGKSSLDAVEALRATGAEVIGMAAIFTYGFEIAKENFEIANCELITLSNYTALIKEAMELNYVDEESLQSLKEWRSNPQNWSA
jgi:orotate phosphoribosyltransferase